MTSTRSRRSRSTTAASRSAAASDDITELMVSYRTGDMWSPHLSFREALIVEIEHFADSIENGTAPMTDGHSGLRVVEMLEAAMRSLRQNGAPIDLMPLARAS